MTRDEFVKALREAGSMYEGHVTIGSFGEMMKVIDEFTEFRNGGFAYRYPDGIRFTDGQEINGCRPIAVIPYYFGPEQLIVRAI
jgi:hypothetical protein